MALREGMIPPTVNFTAPDAACNLNIVANQSRQADIEIALSNTFAFGGLNATLVLKRA
jgi:nodulation protein E